MIVLQEGKGIWTLESSVRVTSAVVVDTGNYYPSRDGRIAEIDGGLSGGRKRVRPLAY
jgi:hypothetical protein